MDKKKGEKRSKQRVTLRLFPEPSLVVSPFMVRPLLNKVNSLTVIFPSMFSNPPFYFILLLFPFLTFSFSFYLHIINLPFSFHFNDTLNDFYYL